jgi:heme-degrading monooxygenase HmoA
MTRLIIRHKVNNYDAWKKVFDNFKDFRKSSGEKSYQIFHPEKDPNNLILMFEWDNTANAQKFFKSQELKDTMHKAGVAEDPQIEFVDEVAHGTL